jgi:hypothetical protein
MELIYHGGPRSCTARSLSRTPCSFAHSDTPCRWPSCLLSAAPKRRPIHARRPPTPESAWTGSEAVLFDDGVDVGALPISDAPPSRDESNEAQIPSRINAAEGVLLAKFISVSTEPSGDRKRYRLELTIEGEPYAGVAPPDMPFSLALEPEAPAYGTIRALDSRLIGRKMVVFYRRYANDDGAAVIHFHLSPATKPVLEAIQLHTTRKQFN